MQFRDARRTATKRNWRFLTATTLTPQ